MKHMLVLGCGSIGQRHLRNAAAAGVTALHAFDPDPARRAAAEALGATVHAELEAALACGAEAVFVCTPPVAHIPLARAALATGAHLFVEKPLSHDLHGVDALVTAAEAAGRVFMVGYNLRFHLGIARLLEVAASGELGELVAVRAEFGQYLPDWRPTQDYRQGYNAHRDQGGGVLLDVSHEIDYLRALTGEIEAVYCLARTTGRLEVDTEDLAALVMRARGDVPVSLHLDCLQRTYSRTCKVVGSAGTAVWDYGRGLDVYTVATRAWRHEALVPDPNLMYVRQFERFRACVAGEAAPPVGGKEAARVLRIVDAARRSSACGAEVRLAP